MLSSLFFTQKTQKETRPSLGGRGWGHLLYVCACVPQGPHTQPSESKPIFPGLPPLSRSFLPRCTPPPPASEEPLFSRPLRSCPGALPDSLPALGSLPPGAPTCTWQCSVRIFCGDIRPLSMQVSQHPSPSTTHLPGKACDCGSECGTQTPPHPRSGPGARAGPRQQTLRTTVRTSTDASSTT